MQGKQKIAEATRQDAHWVSRLQGLDVLLSQCRGGKTAIMDEVQVNLAGGFYENCKILMYQVGDVQRRWGDDRLREKLSDLAQVMGQLFWLNAKARAKCAGKGCFVNEFAIRNLRCAIRRSRILIAMWDECWDDRHGNSKTAIPLGSDDGATVQGR